MRFHIGCSFRPKTLIKYIGLGLLGLLAFMGVHDFAKADTLDYTNINVVNNSNQSTLSCNFNSARMCPTNISMFPYPGKTEYLVKHLYISFGNNQLTSGHNYNFQIQFHILRPESDTDFQVHDLLFYLSDNTSLVDNIIFYNQNNYYDSMYGETAAQFNYSGSFTSSKNLPFFLNLNFEYQEGIYGIFIDSVYLFDNDTGQEIIDSNTQNTIDMMNNQNQNTTNIINNDNSNTQQIIDNQNALLGDSCSNLLDLSSPYLTERVNYNLISNGIQIDGIDVFGNVRYKVPIESGKTYSFKGNFSTSHSDYVMLGLSYDINFSSWLYLYEPNTSFGSYSTSFTPSSDGYVYLGLWSTKSNFPNTATFYNVMLSSESTSYCKYGSTLSKLDSTNQSLQELNNTISDDSIDTSTSNDFFDNFEDNHHGLSGIVSLPLTTIQSLNNASCTPLTLTIPYLQSNNTLQFPCLTPIYQENFGTFFTLYQTIIFGLISYYVCISIFYMVKDFKDPNKDKIEVMDL